MYLFDLYMWNIKSEARAQECSKRKVFLRILQNSLCAGVSFIIKIQAAWINQTFMFTFYPAQVFSSEICEIFRNTLKTPTIPSYKVLFVNC